MSTRRLPGCPEPRTDSTVPPPDRKEHDHANLHRPWKLYRPGHSQHQRHDKARSAVKESATKVGASVKNLYWTLGAYDVVTVVDAPDDQSAAALLFSIGSLGNVRTQSLKAFEADEVERILGKI